MEISIFGRYYFRKKARNGVDSASTKPKVVERWKFGERGGLVPGNKVKLNLLFVGRFA